MTAAPPHVGTLREKPLHASLKRWYAEPGDRVEVPVDGFVIDLVRDDLLIEIQTRGFSSMRRKLAALLEGGHRVLLVHPVPVEKSIVKIGPDGVEIGRRRSPKHGRAVDVFAELASFPELVAHPGLCIEVVLTRECEHRVHDPSRNRRRKGWAVEERRLVEVVDIVALREPSDLAALLPADLPDPFTTADLATGIRRPRRLAQQMAYCLRRTGMVEPTGKRGNAIEYRRTDV
ncbi:MAG: hypothetical protein QNJ12_04030 [Ilumatobacter sp.]|uniref:hypothetical protein n=1 Tax=Ilumatobacter sp. TaxID=1967498 RepID=UPI0026224516|nr:hypothetical protein [Ilumatobacter sp.]MDJ0767932.1 hypothetical protein [Ilumatobacter sp.]